MSEAKRHFKITLKVRYRTKDKVKHTLEKPGVWPFNRKKREGTTTTLLECDDCVIRVAEANLNEVIEMITKDRTIKNLMAFYSDAMGDYGCFPENWDDTEWLNTCGMEGDFIHDSYAGFLDEYSRWDTEKIREEHLEELRSCDEEVVAPARRIMGYQNALDQGDIEEPWVVTDSAEWGGWASGAFYPDFQQILIDEVKLIDIKAVTEGAGASSSSQNETVMALKEFKALA